MKRLLSICLFVAISIGSSSFSDRNLKQNQVLPRVYWTINHYEPILGTNCTAKIHFSGYFDWNPLTGAVTNITYNTPTITVTCSGGMLSRQVNSGIETLTFDSYGYVTDLEFSETEDGEVDDIITDPDVIENIIEEMNSQIHSQLYP